MNIYARSENEAWVVNRGGDVAEKKARIGLASLSTACKAFWLPRKKLQQEYFERFQEMSNELKNAEPGAPPNGGPVGRAGKPGVGGGTPSVS